MKSSRQVMWAVQWAAFVLGSFWLTSCTSGSSENVDSSFIHLPGEGGATEAPKMSWDKKSIDLGMVAAGEKRDLQYMLTNSGNSPMVITQILPTCGCTVAKDWDRSPLPPGESRDITLSFQAGEQTKKMEESATVVSNAIPSSVELSFTAQIIGPDTPSSLLNP